MTLGFSVLRLLHVSHFLVCFSERTDRSQTSKDPKDQEGSERGTKFTGGARGRNGNIFTETKVNVGRNATILF